MAVSFADVFESAVANSVTSWPRATSPSVSSDVIVSTEPDLGGGIVVATGAMCAILIGRPGAGDGPSRTRDLQQLRQHDARVEVCPRDLDRPFGVAAVVPVDLVNAGEHVVHVRKGQKAVA